MPLETGETAEFPYALHLTLLAHEFTQYIGKETIQRGGHAGHNVRAAQQNAPCDDKKSSHPLREQVLDKESVSTYIYCYSQINILLL